MKKILLLTSLIILLQIIQNNAYANVETGSVSKTLQVKVFSKDNKTFGRKNTIDDKVIIEPQYKKIIRLGESSFIVQKKNKFGLIDLNGNIIVPIEFSHVERLLGKYVKIGKYGKYALYDENGKMILDRKYSSIDLLFGGMLLTCQNFKYGVTDFKGRTILENKFDDIYMPKPNVMRVKYNGMWYEIEQVSRETLSLPDDVKDVMEDKSFVISELIQNPTTMTGYSLVSFTDYLLKIFSSISPSHEQTIDELMLSQGADTMSIFIKLLWLPKYPFVYAKHYYNNLISPNNGPLSDIKYDIKRQIK